ncbi:MAG: hypothetical protein HY043_16780 [Verrucomicrobia bacterium]|nr:hypothetical protein [Verrucomicrobiota bacterium]
MDTGKNRLFESNKSSRSNPRPNYTVMKRFSSPWFRFQLLKAGFTMKALMQGLWKWTKIIVRWVEVFIRWIWEAFCWFVIPAGFGLLAYLSIFKQVSITVVQVVLVALALSPWILRMMAHYLSEFSIGVKGVSGKMKEGVMIVKSEETSDNQTVSLANEVQPSALEKKPEETKIELSRKSKFQTFQPESKKILKTLWNYQRAHLPGNDNERWGFSMMTTSPILTPFSLALLELLKLGLVFIGNKGMTFLSDEGLKFCRDNSEEILAYPSFYSKFAN